MATAKTKAKIKAALADRRQMPVCNEVDNEADKITWLLTHLSLDGPVVVLDKARAAGRSEWPGDIGGPIPANVHVVDVPLPPRPPVTERTTCDVCDAPAATLIVNEDETLVACQDCHQEIADYVADHAKITDLINKGRHSAACATRQVWGDSDGPCICAPGMISVIRPPRTSVPAGGAPREMPTWADAVHWVLIAILACIGVGGVALIAWMLAGAP